MPNDNGTNEQTTDALAASGSAAAPEAAQAPPGGDSDTTEETAALRKELAAVRKEAAGYRTKLKQHEDAQLTESQKLEQERDQARGQLEEATVRTRDLQVQIAADAVGVRKDARADVARLLDWSTITDPSDPAQIEAAIKALVKGKPYLSGAVASAGLNGGSGRNGVQVGDSPNDIFRRAAGRA